VDRDDPVLVVSRCVAPAYAGVAKVVLFGDLNGNVIAYKTGCRSDGGVCTPSWTKNIGAAVAGGLTVRNGVVYAPAADGKVHVLNPTTGVEATPITVSGSALSTWIAFAADGGGYVGHGTNVAQTVTNTGATSDVSYGGNVSNPAVGADTAYVTMSNNALQQAQFGWSATLAGSGCFLSTPPAFGDGKVFAAGCTSLGAYDPGTGSLFWTITTPGPIAGLSYANGILYACVNSRVVAYAGGYGGPLWSGGYCSAAPIVANGVLYVSYASVSAYTLNAAQTTLRAKARPDPGNLRSSSAPYYDFWTGEGAK
jgi:hypothetical protein